jgi:hypothetical protein
MSVREQLVRFARKPRREKWAAVKVAAGGIFGRGDYEGSEHERLRKLFSGTHAPPAVLRGSEKVYLAYRPDSDVSYSCHPEIAHLSEKWVKGNVANNAGDLPRLYSIILNAKQVLEENVAGEIAELGVYKGNSAAVLAYYAREFGRRIVLFDTFEGFDRDDLAVGENYISDFSMTSIDQVERLVGTDQVMFVKGRFPFSIPEELQASRFCLAHIDCDLYEPAKSALEFFYPRLSPGGLLIVHDYANPYWAGIKRAVDEYCADIPERPVIFGDKSGTAMIRRSMPS